MYRVSGFVQHFAWALLAGSLIATFWVNLDPSAYYDFIEWRLAALPDPLHQLGQTLTLRDLVSEGLMALFVFYLGKELWEAMQLDRGALRGKTGGVPIFGAIGGIIGAALSWLVLSALFQTAEEAGALTGWPVPLGSDVVLTYLFARSVFGAGSRAVHVLLLLTITMDITGLLLHGFIYPYERLNLLWLGLPLCSSMAVWWMYGRHIRDEGNEQARQRALYLWPYVLAGMIGWYGVAMSGLPPALGLLPLLPAIPHADHAFGMFAEAEEYLTDPLNRFAQLLVRPLICVMFLLGLTHGGIDFAAWTVTTAILLGALWLGKPVGILVGALILAPRFGYRLPQGMRRRDMVLLAGLCGIGFTVPALTLDTALPGGSMQEAARLGLALSLFAGPVTVVIARWLRQKRQL